MTTEERLAKEVGGRLNEVRNLIGKYQTDIAKEYARYSKLSFNQSVISSYENGKLRPSFLYLKFLAEKYGINTNYLLTGTGDVFKDTKTEGVIVIRKDALERLERDLGELTERVNSLYK